MPDLSREHIQNIDTYLSLIQNYKNSCSCADPTLPLPGDMKGRDVWLAHHQRMLNDAKNSSDALDVVFIDDSITERWNGTKALAIIPMESGMRDVFQELFTKKREAL